MNRLGLTDWQRLNHSISTHTFIPTSWKLVRLAASSWEMSWDWMLSKTKNSHGKFKCLFTDRQEKYVGEGEFKWTQESERQRGEGMCKRVFGRAIRTRKTSDCYTC